jgi:hypothetical protein
MKSLAPLAVFKAGTNVIQYISAIFLVIAIILPIYFYPGYFLASVVNYAPFLVLSIFIIGYNVVQYRKRADIEIFEDKIIIVTTNKRFNVYYSDIQNITRDVKDGKKLFIIQTKSGRKIALYDRRLITFKTTLIDFIKSRTSSGQS